MDRKRQRKDTLYVSKRHLRRLAAQEADIISAKIFQNTSLSRNDSTCTANVINDRNNDRIDSTIDIEKMDFDDVDFVQYENSQSDNESESLQSSFNVSRNELNDELNVASEHVNDFQDEITFWAVEHQITHTPLKALLLLLRKHHRCFSTFSLDARTFLKTPRRQDIRTVVPDSQSPQGTTMKTKCLNTRNIVSQSFTSHSISLDLDNRVLENAEIIDTKTSRDDVTGSYNFCGAIEEGDLDVNSTENQADPLNIDERFIANDENIPPSQVRLIGRTINYEGRSDFERYVLKKFQHLEIKINYIAKQQKQILNKISHATSVQIEEEQEKIDVFQDLPLRNRDDLQIMENKLDSEHYRNEMIKQLQRLTRHDVKQSCLCLMKQILSNEVAVLFSWHGAKGKEHFSKLSLCKVILSVIRNAHEFVKDEQISNPIKIWLAHAKERMDREREKKRQNEDEVRNNEEPDDSH